MGLTEHQEQCAVVGWARAVAAACPPLDNLFAIPNGAQFSGLGQRLAVIVAGRLKAEGLKPGVPDLFLAWPMPRRTGFGGGLVGGSFGGAFLEMKRAWVAGTPNRPVTSPAQAAWLRRLAAAGYATMVAYGADEAIAFLCRYLARADLAHLAGPRVGALYPVVFPGREI